MSCMNLDTELYQFVADTICKLRLSYGEFYDTRRLLNLDLDSATIEKSILQFVRTLQEWNLIAYNTRYKSESELDQIDYVDYVGFGPMGLNLCKLAKCLECIDYQCSDSKAYCDSPAKKILDTVLRESLEAIVHDNPAYQAAKWGTAADRQ